MCKREIIILVCLSAVIAIVFNGSRGLYETTEGRYAECAMEMIETGNYLEPVLDYSPHWSKPPLTYWLIAGGMKLLGYNEWGSRLYTAVCFFLTVFVVAGLGSVLWNPKTGVVAGFVYATSPFAVISANVVSTDIVLTLWETAAVLSFLKAFNSDTRRSEYIWAALMWVFFGLGFLTKGPPSLLPLIPILIWNCRNNNPAKILNITGVLMFIIIGLSWYFVCLTDHPGLFSYWIGHEIVDRTVSGDFHNNRWYSPFVLYVPVLALGSGPWLFYPLRKFLSEKVPQKKQIWCCIKENSRNLFLLLWILIPLTVFFLAKSRLVLYVLPIYVPVALIVSRIVCISITKQHLFKKVISFAIVAGLFLVGIKGAIAWYPSGKDMEALYQLCSRFDNKKTSCIVFGEDKLFGFQFYLNNDLTRISLSGDVKIRGEKKKLKDVLNRIKASWPERQVIIISSCSHSTKLERALHKNGFLFSCSGNRFWKLYNVRPSEEQTIKK